LKIVLSWIARSTGFVLMIMTHASCKPSSHPTGIEGAVTISPSRPGPTRAEESSALPLKNASFAVENENGDVARFATNELGKFRVSLKPGHYKISVEGENRIRRCGPFEVDVAANEMKAVQWNCDSGMR
jgi:hypothetical protein